MRIIAAPNALKGTLSAYEAAAAIGEGIRRAAPRAHVVECPIADGGDGTREVLVRALYGETRSAPARDPLGRQGSGDYGLIDEGSTGVIDVASASGLVLLEPSERDPLRASSYGTGELMLAALGAGAKRLILGAGGSATVDGGTGLLAALGVRFIDAKGRPLTPNGAALVEITDIDLRSVWPRVLETPLVVACDVKSTLLGPGGSASEYGPQKGANAEAVERLERGLERFSSAVLAVTGRDGRSLRFGGAAGGIGAGLWAVLGAELVSGVDLVLDRIGFDRLLPGTDAVVTAEGRLDEQSLQGKGPIDVARRAQRAGVPAFAIVGSIAPGFDLQRTPFASALTLAEDGRGADRGGGRARGQTTGARERLRDVAERVPAELRSLRNR